MHALGAATAEEEQHPRFYRFWRRLPPKGTIGIFLGTWYTQPIIYRAFGALDSARYDLEPTLRCLAAHAKAPTSFASVPWTMMAFLTTGSTMRSGPHRKQVKELTAMLEKEESRFAWMKEHGPYNSARKRTR